MIAISSGALGCFLALLLILLMALFLMCFYRLFCYKETNQSPSSLHPHLLPTNVAINNPQLLPPPVHASHCIGSMCRCSALNPNTVAVVRDVIVPKDDDIKVVMNPCFKSEFSISDESDYPVPPVIHSLDNGGFSREENI